VRNRYGADSWVVISGASNDMGREYSNYFAKHGFKLYLLDTDVAALEQLKQDLANKGFSVDIVIH